MSASCSVELPSIPSGEDHLRRPRTALAFMLSPGIAALVGSTTFVAYALATRPAPDFGEAVSGLVFFAFWTGLVGYLTAGIFAAPLYAFLPESVRRDTLAVVLLAGMSAAAPWLLFSLPFGAALLIGAAVAFGLGCGAGVAFVLIRGALPAAAEGGMP